MARATQVELQKLALLEEISQRIETALEDAAGALTEKTTVYHDGKHNALKQLRAWIETNL